jgi:predicted RNase H-like HicB family nuclease
VNDPRPYLVVFQHTDGTGYSAWAPDLPCCVRAAGTREECEQLIREAIVLDLKGMRGGEQGPRAIVREFGDR